jgi:hypothetical protein
MSNNIIMSGDQIAELLSSDLTSVYFNYEWVEDPNSAYGYKSVLVIRTDGTNNEITIGTGTANSKLGFAPGSYSFGNFSDVTLYNTYNQSEYVYDSTEISYLIDEGIALNTIINSITPNLLNRASPTNIALCNSAVQANARNEATQIQGEISKLNTQISSLSKIMLEPSMPAYTDSSAAYNDASSFLNDCSFSLLYDTSMATNYMDKIYTSQWILNTIHDTSSIQNVSWTNSFTIQVPTDQTRRILNATVDNTSYHPSVIYADTGLPVSGTWSGWDLSADSSYSTPTNIITFTIGGRPSFSISNNIDLNASFFVNNNGVGIFYNFGHEAYFPYNTISPPTVTGLVTAINNANIPNITATVVTDSTIAFIPIISEYLPTYSSSFIYPSLRDCTAYYSTMDSQNLNDRASFVTERLEDVNNRIISLTNRMAQIKQHIIDEEYFMATDGTNTGNLYNWAANRFNRSNGSEARLKQIEKTIEMNQSSLSVSKQFL